LLESRKKKGKKKEEKKVGNVLPEFRRNLSSGTNSLAGRKKVGKSQKSRKVGWKRRIFAGIGYDEDDDNKCQKRVPPQKRVKGPEHPPDRNLNKKKRKRLLVHKPLTLNLHLNHKTKQIKPARKLKRWTSLKKKWISC
jgi:hypothetical protein